MGPGRDPTRGSEAEGSHPEAPPVPENVAPASAPVGAPSHTTEELEWQVACSRAGSRAC